MKQRFIDLETKWIDAWKNKDEATVRNLLADEFTLTSSLTTGDLVNKEAWIENVLHNFNCKELHITKLEAQVYDKTAILHIWLRQEAVVNGKDWNGDFLLTDVWIEKNKEWRAVTRHSSWLQKR